MRCADAVFPKPAALKESTQECGGFIRDAHNLFCCLTIELEVEFGLGPTIIPVGESFELAPAQVTLCERRAPDGDAHARRLPGDPGFLWNRFGRGNNSTGDETRTTLVFACEDKDHVAPGDVLAAVHRLLPAELERI